MAITLSSDIKGNPANVAAKVCAEVNADRIGGVAHEASSLSQLNTWITDETARIALDPVTFAACIWGQGHLLRVATEAPGVLRQWDREAVTPNALTVILPNASLITLAATTNTVLSTDGTPDAGDGADGDYAFDPATSTLYGPKATTWPSGLGLFASSKSDVGLGNVDNTSDLNKPVSTATQIFVQAVHNGSYGGTDYNSAAGTRLFDHDTGTVTATGSYATVSDFGEFPAYHSKLFPSGVKYSRIAYDVSEASRIDATITATTTFADLKNVVIPVYVPPGQGKPKLQIYIEEVFNYSKYYTAYFRPDDIGWGVYAIPASAFSASGSPTGTDTLLRVRVKPVASEWTSGDWLAFGDIYFGATAKPKWCFTFDDNRKNLVSTPHNHTTLGNKTIKSIMDDYGFKGTCYVQPNEIGLGPGVNNWNGSVGNETLENLLALEADGWTVGFQSPSNLDGDGASSGIRLWGGGFKARAFTGADSGDLITATDAAARFLLNQPVVFAGETLPGDVVAGVTYYCRDISNNTFKLSRTLGGVAFGFTSDGSGTFESPGCTSDYLGIYNRLKMAYDTLVYLGFNPESAKHMALQQGGIDSYVETAVEKAIADGWIRTVRGISGSGITEAAQFPRLPYGLAASIVFQGKYGSSWLSLPGFNTFESGSTSDMEALVNITQLYGGCIFGVYGHYINSDAKTDNLIALCERAATLEAANLLDIVTVHELDCGLLEKPKNVSR